MLGGGRYAGWLAGLSVLAGGALQLFGILMITDTLQPLAWLACGVCIIRAELDEEPRWWLALGVIAGVAFLAKYTVALYLGAIAPASLATPRAPRAGALGAVGGGPHRPHRSPRRTSIWQADKRLAVPRPRRRARGAQEHSVLARSLSVVQEVLTLGPAWAPIWLAGLAAFASWSRFAHSAGSPSALSR